MAMTTGIPPQAYTRDTLVKAIEWLSGQPASVRERANSADLVVSHYLQARRRAAAQNEAPISGENFKSDLKHLAEDLKQFEDPIAPPIVNRSSSHVFTPPPPAIEPGPKYFKQDPIFKPEPIPRPEPPAPPKAMTWQVDARSLAAARELQQRLNLSSEGEALRLLITLGIERARELMP